MGAPPCAIVVVVGLGAPVREVIGVSTGGIVTCGDGAPTRLALNAVDDPAWGARSADGGDATWCDQAPVRAGPPSGVDAVVRGIPLGSGGSLCPVVVIALAVAPSFPPGPLVVPAIAIRAASLPGSGGSECWPRFGSVPAVPVIAALALAATLPVPTGPLLAVRAVGTGG